MFNDLRLLRLTCSSWLSFTGACVCPVFPFSFLGFLSNTCFRPYVAFRTPNKGHSCGSPSPPPGSTPPHRSCTRPSPRLASPPIPVSLRGDSRAHNGPFSPLSVPSSRFPLGSHPYPSLFPSHPLDARHGSLSRDDGFCFNHRARELSFPLLCYLSFTLRAVALSPFLCGPFFLTLSNVFSQQPRECAVVITVMRSQLVPPPRATVVGCISSKLFITPTVLFH
ncbi:hypothetical protein F5148DRAFT_1216763 [Russula earlei]|uniref:Uncharacterized protein n=1 Tax=Russula earlei TaxID=71964 RepID=A0ACC0U3L6_9AGAM|nr:hypothetical protein F5148DRAFT_1216763 [Russula earlei]